MEIYRLEENDMDRIDEHNLNKEIQLENRLVRTEAAQIGGIDILYVGRQGTLTGQGIFDILGVDKNGNIVVIELKRDEPPRGVITQALEYASDLQDAEYDLLNKRYRSFLSDELGYYEEEIINLQQAHADYFDLKEPLSKDSFNAKQRLLIVGTTFEDKSLLRMIDFLREHEIDVVAVEYTTYIDNKTDTELLTTDAIRRPLSEEPTRSAESDLLSQPWKTDGKEWHLETQTNEQTSKLLQEVVDELSDIDFLQSPSWNQKPYIAFEDTDGERRVVIFTRKTLFKIRVLETVDSQEERDAIANRLGISEADVERTTNNRDDPRLRIRIREQDTVDTKDIRKEVVRILSSE